MRFALAALLLAGCSADVETEPCSGCRGVPDQTECYQCNIAGVCIDGAWHQTGYGPPYPPDCEPNP